ncbi:MAG: PDZ domain-containing protein, partial [Vicinamibacterales bacterium]
MAPRSRGFALISAAIVIAATAVYSLGWMYYAGVVPRARLGVTPEHRVRTADLLVTAVESGAPAARAGLQAGDRIVEINGRPLDTPNPFFDAVTRGRPGDVVRLRVDRGGRSFTTHASLEPRPPAAPQSRARLFVQLLLRFYPAEFFIVAAVVLLQRPQDRTAWLLALLFITLIAAAPLEEALIHPAFRRFAVGFKVLGGVLPAAVYGFFAVFPAQSPIDRRVPWLKNVLLSTALALAAVLGILAYRAGSLAPVRGITETTAWPIVGPLFLLYSVLALALGLGSLVLNNLRAQDAEARRRTRVLAWGMVAGLTPICVLQTVAEILDINPYYQVPFWVWAPAVLALFLIPLSFAYAVVKYRVLEIPVLLKRSARYLLVQRGFVALLFLLSAGATIALALELPLLLPARVEAAAPVGLI